MRKLPPNFLPSFGGRPGTGEVREVKNTHGAQTWVPCGALMRVCPVKLAPFHFSTGTPASTSVPAQSQHGPVNGSTPSIGGAPMLE